MKFLLRDRNPALVAAWRKEFVGSPDVEVSQGDIFDLTADAIVSPANSFGFMDGGIDLVYSQRFGWTLQKRLQQLLRDEYDGELPVGQAVIVPTDDADIPLVISAPTMRVPMDISNTVNAYLAFRAAIRSARAYNTTEKAIESILCPGLGTATGRIPPAVCARQMRYAHEASTVGARTPHETLGAAMDVHRKMLEGAS
jgi:O-acetyl-ADP-ribose deacetylase (regulator of RNase III)